MPDLERCKHCHRPVRFVTTLKGAAAMLDPDPVATGNVMIGNDGRARFAQTKVRQCRCCGCVDTMACTSLLARPGYFVSRERRDTYVCAWIEDDLCSACQGAEPRRYVVHQSTCPNKDEWAKGPGPMAEAVRAVREAILESNELERTGTRDALEGGPVAAKRAGWPNRRRA